MGIWYLITYTKSHYIVITLFVKYIMVVSDSHALPLNLTEGLPRMAGRENSCRLARARLVGGSLKNMTWCRTLCYRTFRFALVMLTCTQKSIKFRVSWRDCPLALTNQLVVWVKLCSRSKASFILFWWIFGYVHLLYLWPSTVRTQKLNEILVSIIMCTLVFKMSAFTFLHRNNNHGHCMH